MCLAKADLTTSSGVHDAANSSPKDFYVQLAADPTSKATAITTLEASGTPSDLVLAAAIKINTTDAGAVVDSIASQLPTLMSSTTALSSASLAASIAAILPPDIDLTSATAPTAFTDMVNAFLSASTNITYVVNLGGTLPAVPGGTSQDTAYIGLVALAVSAVTPTSGMTVAEALWAAIQNPTVAPNFTIDATTFSMTAGSTASTLLTAAGISTTAF